MELQQLLTETAQRKASDLHLKPALEADPADPWSPRGAGRPPADHPRVHATGWRRRLLGEHRLQHADGRPGDGPGLHAARASAASACNLFLARARCAASSGTCRSASPPSTSCTCPRSSSGSAMERRGMILVTGITGSGKSTSARVHDRLHEPEPERPHRHDRGPDRVRAPGQEVRDQPARDRPRLGELRPGPARRPPRGPRHHAGRRDARRGDHGSGASTRRRPATSCSPRCTP